MLRAELKVVGGEQDGQVIQVNASKFLIGREHDCHFRPKDESVSRHHCALLIDDYAVRIRDLGSTNGTFVNGQRIQGQVVLKTGDRIQVGDLTFEVIIPVQVESAQATAAQGQRPSSPSGVQPTTQPQTPPPAAPIPNQATQETVNLSGSDTSVIYAPQTQQPQGQPLQPPGTTGIESPTPPPQTAAQPPTAVPPQGAPQQTGWPQGTVPPPSTPQPQAPQAYPGPQWSQAPQQPPGVAPEQPTQPVVYPQQGQPPVQQGVPPVQPSPARRVVVDLPPVRLPDPSETGIKDQTPTEKQKEPKEDEGEQQKKPDPTQVAAEIIRKYMRRRG